MPDRSSDDLTPSKLTTLYRSLFDTAVSLANLKLDADLRMPDDHQRKVYRYHARRKALQELGDRWQQSAAVQRTRRP